MKDQTLNEIFNPKYNNIGFIRLVSALLVVVGHSIPYGGWGTDSLITLTNNQIAIGRFPVDIFFALSGYLITSSYLTSGSITVFLWHRFLRIYPAFWVCIILTGLILPLIFDLKPDLHYILRNFPIVLKIDPNVTGLFTNLPAGENINSSLWTLPWECYSYAMIGLLGVTRLLTKKSIIVGLFIISWLGEAYTILTHPSIESTAAIGNGFRLFTYFLCGSCFFLFKDKIIINSKIALGALLFIILSIVLGLQIFHYSGGLYYLLTPIPFTYLVFWLSIFLPFQKINIKYDFSYGIYIYGTLILNLFTSIGLNNNYVSYLFLTLVTTFILSAFSWYLIEKPSLKLKKSVPFMNNLQTKYERKK
jgi:peptidoglycan/LPS O-acetylase OafA/YrhL